MGAHVASPRLSRITLSCHRSRSRCFGTADGIPIQEGNSILLDGTGGFWIGSDTSLVHWKAGVSEVYELQALRSNSGQGGIEALARNSDGSLWVGKRIVEATQRLLRREGYAGTTIEAIAQEAEVSVPSVYAIFKSKTGILKELVDQAGFGPDYESAVQRALNAPDPVVRLRLAAPIARGIHESQSAILDLLRGAGVVAPELARLERQKEQRYKREEGTIALLRSSGKLRAGLDYTTARDIFWALTGRDLYRMLVRERGWSADKYEDWLADTLVRSLVDLPRRDHTDGLTLLNQRELRIDPF